MKLGPLIRGEVTVCLPANRGRMNQLMKHRLSIRTGVDRTTTNEHVVVRVTRTGDIEPLDGVPKSRVMSAHPSQAVDNITAQSPLLFRLKYPLRQIIHVSSERVYVGLFKVRDQALGDLLVVLVVGILDDELSKLNTSADRLRGVNRFLYAQATQTYVLLSLGCLWGDNLLRTISPLRHVHAHRTCSLTDSVLCSLQNNRRILVDRHRTQLTRIAKPTRQNAMHSI